MKKAERAIGIVKIGVADGVEFIEGRLNLSEILAPKVIEKARSFINPQKLTIIDVPPGTSCSVFSRGILSSVKKCIPFLESNHGERID